MKTIFIIVVAAFAVTQVTAQKPFNYALYADGLVNPQLPKSNLYAQGAGMRGEISKELTKSRNTLFAQLGYGHFFRRKSGAMTADLMMVATGFRYQSKRAFFASLGLGAQYWTEKLVIRYSDKTVEDRLTGIMPSASLGFGFRVGADYRIGIDYRALFKPENGAVLLRNNLALSFGYAF
ncbi:hypothetical protein [Dyadobacter arcticus]|uniref:Outer membrane protein beta-barrel domain-containing protein n=1 Tax=Dyadobacter arcticus TaxID=1078754 RepID=A0ABX0UP39_9BACT|nr:hypothetical protein [Dyadobacter arcticus]NIJ54731.1 hypothetical protein [Dyadobacter arcticus]